MSLYGQTQSSELAEDRGSVGLAHRCSRPGVQMDVANVTGPVVSPSAGAIDQTGGVVFLDPFGDALDVILTPSFVEADPHYDRWMVVESVDHSL